MRAAIDGAGRIVVPKPLREALGFEAGQELELTARDGRLEVEVPPVEVRLEDRGSGPVAVADADMPTLTTDAVREVLESVRR